MMNEKETPVGLKQFNTCVLYHLRVNPKSVGLTICCEHLNIESMGLASSLQ